MQTTHTHYRTYIYGELRMEYVSQTVTLADFLENVREMGQSFAFAVLRDFCGATQVVVENEAIWKTSEGLNKEPIAQITGVVRERDSKSPKLPIGNIEVVPEAVEVLGCCRHSELPFQINRSREADKSARLKYRHLNLRNPEVKNNIILRCQAVAVLWKAMLDHGFLEIATLILTASSPEGARDHLVLSRRHPGKFYALPQASQQFKQLLMASGFDKYFQIAPCFRDEDARGDRSPGELYQLDMEMVFADQKDVFTVLEDVLSLVFVRHGTYNVASTVPFRRISYREAMDKHGFDKPGLRINLIVTDATEVLDACGFGLFERNTVKAVVVTGFEGTRKQIDKLCVDVEVQSSEKVYWFRYDENGEIVDGIAKFVQPVKDAAAAALGPEKGCFVGLTAGKLLAAQKATGVPCSKLGAFCPSHMDKERYEFCWIVDLPMYEIGEESGLLEFYHSPFSMPNDGLEILKKAAAGEANPLSITTFQYNLVCSGVELSSGAVRNHDPEIMIEAFQLVRLGEDDVKAKFPAMYNAFTYGAPPHTGITPGADRMVTLLAGEDSIREIISLLMNKNTQDLTMDAPSFVIQVQLGKLDIVRTKKEEDEVVE